MFQDMQGIVFRCLLVLTLFLMSACGSTPEKVLPVETGPSWSTIKKINTTNGMITLMDPADLAHHQHDPSNWYLYDFAIRDDLKTGRFAAVLTGKPGTFNVRLTFQDLTEAEQAAAGPQAKLRLRVINHRLLLTGGETWPSIAQSYKKYAHDPRWIGFENGDYGVIITALNPESGLTDYVFQLTKLSDMTVVKHAPAMPQLVYGSQAAVVGLNADGFAFDEQCRDMPGKATWIPLARRTMPIPGAIETVEIPRSLHGWAMDEKRAGRNPELPLVLARDPGVGTFGFYVKHSEWTPEQLRGEGQAYVSTLIRCAVEITGVVPEPNSFKLQLKSIPTAADRLPAAKKQQLVKEFDHWVRVSNDPAWRFKSAKIRRTNNDADLILGVLGYLNLSVKESESLIPLSNAVRVDYLLERLGTPMGQ